MSIIKKSLLIFIILFIAFNVFLIVIHKGEFKSAQYQYQNNIIKAEKYLYSKTVPTGVLIGTSLSGKFIMDSLPGVTNLALSGLNIFDGLQIILKREKFPKIVFIETNFFYRPENKLFTGSFNSPLNSFFKRNLLGLREENQPVGLILHVLKSYKKNPLSVSVVGNEMPLPKDIFLQLLKRQEDTYGAIDTLLLNDAVVRLNKYIQELTSRNVKVILFEVPVNGELENLPLAVKVRTAIKDRVANSNNIYTVELPRNQTYMTVDGIHLDDKSIRQYMIYFNEALNRFNLFTH